MTCCNCTEQHFHPLTVCVVYAGPSHIQQPVLRRPSWKGSKESLAPQRHSGLYRSNSPSPQPDLPRPSNFPQSHAAGVGGQRVNPPPSSWDSNPATKRYSGNMDYLTRVSPIPQGPWAESYSNPSAQAQRGISPVPMGRQPIIMQGSGGNKFTYPPSWPQNGSSQVDYGHSMAMVGNSRQPQPPPPYPLAQGSGHSPTAQQMQAPPPSWPHNMPARSNSFANAAPGTRQCQPAASSQPSATTVTAITQAPVLQPVKSTRVLKPELHTAVAPTHPPWLQQQQQQPPPPSPYQETSVPAPAVSQMPGSDVPGYQGPPPPYPKHLLQQQQPSACQAFTKEDEGAEDDTDNASTCSSERTDASETVSGNTEREKKQITTSPVPVRKNKRDEERRGEGRVQLYSPQAFKFYMEQHVENILKNHQQRLRRKKQLESEMQRVRTPPVPPCVFLLLIFHFLQASLFCSCSKWVTLLHSLGGCTFLLALSFFSLPIPLYGSWV